MVTGDGVTTSYQYDIRLRLTQLKASGSNGVLYQDLRYQFDGVSNILHIDDARPERTPQDDDTRTFTLDDLYRLTGVRYVGGSGDWIDYAYNPIGNMLQKSSNLPVENLGAMHYGQEVGPHAVTQVGPDRWRYDANGNLVSKPGFTYTWDFHDRLVGVEGADGLRQSHSFDYSDRRVVKQVQTITRTYDVLYPNPMAEVRDGQWVKYVFAGEERVAEIRTPFTSTRLVTGFSGELAVSSPQEDSIGGHEGNYRVFLANISNSGDSVVEIDDPVAFYHADHLGSTSFVLGGRAHLVGQMRYTPFGQERVHKGESNLSYRFAGHEHDAGIDLYNFGARFYDTLTGHFLSTDPSNSK